MEPFMYRTLLLFTCLFFTSVVKSDPFYSDQQREDKIAKSHFHPPACKPLKKIKHIYLPIDFYELNFVGVVKIDKNIKAIFMDKQNKIIDLNQDELLIPSYIQIEHMDLKQISIIDWKNSEICQTPSRFYIKL